MDQKQWKVRILHISDLHERGPREKESFRRRRVLGDAWRRNLDRLLEDGAIDLVCFTGDAADWGRPEEYGPVTDFLQALLAQLSLPLERFFLVPGNHDIDRSQGKSAWSRLRGRNGKLSRLPPLELSRWMAGVGAPPLGLQKNQREELLSRQSAYREWVATKLGRRELVPSPEAPHKFLGYRQTLRLPDRPFELHVVGLDSAWLAGDDSDSGKLLLTTDQVGRLTMDARGEALPGFRLALVHHPLSDLADRSECQPLLADNVDLLLRGHLHEAQLETWIDPDRTSRQLAAGCLYEGHQADTWPNSCHVIQAMLDEKGRPLRYELRFRSWSHYGHWYDDNRRYESTQNGRFTWWVGERPVRDALPQTGHFIGRTRELEKLREALLPADRRPVAICALHGMPGVGKSYLATRFAELHSASFPGGCVRLALDPAALLSAEALLGQLGSKLELPAGAQLAERCRERLLRPLSLLIVDNVDSPEAAAVAVKLSASLQGCPLLVTGRYQGFADTGGWTRLEVETLDERTALELLEQEFRPAADARERERYRLLVQALGYLPLALHLSAGYLRAEHSIESFLRLLRERDFNLELSPNDPLMADGARAIIRGTFELSMKLMRHQLGEKAERWMSGLAALGHAPLSGFGQSLGAAMAGLSEQEFRELVSSATLLSLLSRVPRAERKDDAWRVHPLLAELLRGSPGASVGLARMTEWFIARLPKLPAGQDQDQGRRWREIHEEGSALVEWLPRVEEKDLVRVERAGSWFAMVHGPFPAWADFCERTLRASLWPWERSDVLLTLSYVARRGGALERALSASREKRALDLEHHHEREAALAASTSADVLQDRGELDEALRIRQEEVLPVVERLGDMYSRAVTLGKVADILQLRGELDEALRIRQEEELPVFERLGDVRERAVTLGRVADILQLRGELDEALRVRQQEELPVYERLGDVRARAISLGQIAEILRVRGQLDEALRILQQEVFPILERLGAVRMRAVTLGSMTDILQARGQLDEALRILQQEVFPIFERLGDVQRQAVTLQRIAGILHIRGEHEAALGILQKQALPVFQRLRIVEDEAVAWRQIAAILHDQGKSMEGLQILGEKALPVFERIGIAREKALALRLKAALLHAQGETTSALRILQAEVLPVFEKMGAVQEEAVTKQRITELLQAGSRHE